MRAKLWVITATVTGCLLVGVNLEPPHDVGTWATEALDGEVVFALAREIGGTDILVGTRRGLYRLHRNGSTSVVSSSGPVRTLAVTAERSWAGTDNGVLSVVDGRLSPGPDGLPRTVIHALADDGERLLVASDQGVYSFKAGNVTKLWPRPGEGPVAVAAVLATRFGVLFAHPEGLALLDEDGRIDMVLPGADVTALGHLDSTGEFWAGTRGAPYLAWSGDDGRTWSPRAEGLGFSATNALAVDPALSGHLVVGGSGLADDTGNAGIQQSFDDARTWQVEQNRLSNTHIFALAVTEEPVRVSFGLLTTDLSIAIPLPMTTTRWYAGANGSGVVTMRPASPVFDALTRTAPYLRLIEPILLGSLILGVMLSAYSRLTRNRATMRAPPSTSRVAPRHRPDQTRDDEPGDF